MSYRIVDMVFDDKGLDDAEFRLKALLAKFCQNDNGTDSFPSNETIMFLTGWSLRKVQMTMTRLIEKEHVQANRYGGRGKHNHYNLIFQPSIWDMHPIRPKKAGIADQVLRIIETQQSMEAQDSPIPIRARKQG